MRKYSPRRASNRWLEGAPEYVLDCFDHPQYADRWTVIYCGQANEIRDSAGNVTHLFGMSHGYHCGGSIEFNRYEAQQFRYHNRHKRVRWLDIPVDMRERFEAWGKESA